jgi:hypothetical protein
MSVTQVPQTEKRKYPMLRKSNLNQICTLVLLSTLGFASVSAFQPKPAQAIVSVVLIPAVPLVSFVGIVAGTYLGVYSLWQTNLNDCSPDQQCQGGGNWYLDTAIGILGLVILDKQSGVPTFTSLSDKDAEALHLSKQEREIFNDNTEELNATLETVVDHVAKENKPTLEASQRLWSAYESALDPSALDVARKVVARYLNNASGVSQTR